MTGTQSGEHGIYGFIDLEPGSYRMFFPNFQQLKVPPVWDELARSGKRSVVINMPGTYPARPLAGALISGFVAIDMNKAVYPPFLIPRLQEMGYQIDIDTSKARSDHEFLFRDLERTLVGRERAFDHLWDAMDWDLFILVITGTDRLLHYLWDAFEDEGHRNHRDFLDYFERVDRFVGRIHDRFRDLDGTGEGRNDFYMISDHGFTGIKTEVYMNQWLRESGYLRFGKDVPLSIEDIAMGSSAFALDPSRIYIHLKDKYPRGSVGPGDYEGVRAEIKEALEALTYTGQEKVVSRVYLKEELFSGPCLDRGPDLVVHSRPGYDLKGRVATASVFGRTDLAGMHTQEDAFFFSDSGEICDSIFGAKEILVQGLSS
jgi:predicted AlkP superfamily phosphohydrolase/phosphomutase